MLPFIDECKVCGLTKRKNSACPDCSDGKSQFIFWCFWWGSLILMYPAAFVVGGILFALAVGGWEGLMDLKSSVVSVATAVFIAGCGGPTDVNDDVYKEAWESGYQAAMEEQMEKEKMESVPVDNSAANEYLLDSAKKGDLGDVQIQLHNGADVNAKNKYGNTALHYAADNGHDMIVKLLIAKGANINEVSGSPPLAFTPLDNALVYKKTEEIADLLRKHGAKTAKEIAAERRRNSLPFP